MKAEIIAVGTELLMGDIINSNAAWLSQALAQAGIDVYYHVTVGDNPARIQKVIAHSLERSDILLFTGGLGPTDDDLTVATLAQYFGSPLILDPDSDAVIRARFAKRGIEMSPSNLKQALRPEDAEVVANRVGTAPGIAWRVVNNEGRQVLIMTFPGVPKELYAMWPEALSKIQAFQTQQGEASEILKSRSLHFFGIGESRVGEMLSDLMDQANPTVAPYVGKAEVRIRIAAKAPTQAMAEALIEPVENEILSRCGQYYIGSDESTLESLVGEKLLALNARLSVAESCTGGLVSSRLTDIPGSSAYIHINFVTYGNEEKTKFLNVQPETLAAYGAVSPQVAREMAIGALSVSGSDVALSITGIAGPDGGSDEKPVGLAYIGLAKRTEQLEATDSAFSEHLPQTWVKKIQMTPTYPRADVKYGFSQAALSYVLHCLNGSLQDDFGE